MNVVRLNQTEINIVVGGWGWRETLSIASLLGLNVLLLILAEKRGYNRGHKAGIAHERKIAADGHI